MLLFDTYITQNCNKKIQPMRGYNGIICQQSKSKQKMLLKHCKKPFSCNLAVVTDKKKQLDLTLFPSHIEKLLKKDLTSTDSEERLLDYDFVNITYNNHSVIM